MTARDRKDAKPMSRFIKLAAVSALALAAAGCSTQPQGPLTPASNFGMYSLHQPVVEHTNYVFDVSAGPTAFLPPSRTGSPPGSSRSTSATAIMSRSISRAAMNRPGPARMLPASAGDFGLLISADGAPVTQGDVPAGVIRVVASRASASVDGCPHRPTRHRIAGPHRHQLRLRDQLQPRRDDRQSGRSRPRPGRLGRRRASSPAARPRPIATRADRRQPLPANHAPRRWTMNAPFHRRARLRRSLPAPSSADEDTAEMLRPIAVEHGWSPEKVNKGGLRNAVQTLSVAASPSILFVDLSRAATRSTTSTRWPRSASRARW
jgi:hypothetical protein